MCLYPLKKSHLVLHICVLNIGIVLSVSCCNSLYLFNITILSSWVSLAVNHSFSWLWTIPL